MSSHNKRIERVVCISPFAPPLYSLAEKHTINDFVMVCRDIGVHIIILPQIELLLMKTCSSMKIRIIKELLKNYAKLFALLRSGSLVLTPYPGLYTPHVAYNFKTFLLSIIKIMPLILIKKLTKYLLLIYAYDLPIEQQVVAGTKFNYNLSRIKEYIIFKKADKILVFNKLNQIAYRENPEIRRKYTTFEIHDYVANQGSQDIDEILKLKMESIKNGINIVLASTNFLHRKLYIWLRFFLDVFSYVPISSKIKLTLIGMNSNVICKEYKDLKFLQCIEQLDYREYTNYLIAKAHFGLIPKYFWYHEFGTTSKFASYIAAGTPVLVPSEYKYLSQIVNKYEVGIVFTDPLDLVNKLIRLNLNNYIKLVKKAYLLGIKVNKGFFLKKTIYNILKHNHD